MFFLPEFSSISISSFSAFSQGKPVPFLLQMSSVEELKRMKQDFVKSLNEEVFLKNHPFWSLDSHSL